MSAASHHDGAVDVIGQAEGVLMERFGVGAEKAFAMHEPTRGRFAIGFARVRPGVMVIRVGGESDRYTAGVWARVLAMAHRVLLREDETLVAAVDAAPGRVVCDVAGMTFVGASGLGVLAEAAACAATDGLEFRISGGDARVRRAIRIAGLEDHLLLEDSPRPSGRGTREPMAGLLGEHQ